MKTIRSILYTECVSPSSPASATGMSVERSREDDLDRSVTVLKLRDARERIRAREGCRESRKAFGVAGTWFAARSGRTEGLKKAKTFLSENELGARDPVSPFCDLDQRCDRAFPAERARRLPPFGPRALAGGRPGTNADLLVVSLPRFAGILVAGVLALAALLSLGIAGVVLFQSYVFRESEVGTRELTGPSRRAEASSSRNQRETQKTAYVETAAAP